MCGALCLGKESEAKKDGSGVESMEMSVISVPNSGDFVCRNECISLKVKLDNNIMLFAEGFPSVLKGSCFSYFMVFLILHLVYFVL